MSHYFSLYLDFVRFIAALAVFFDHITSYPFTKGFFWDPLGSFGGIAVIIFFVLSGYVIAYVTSTRETTAARYASARIARIYSVVFVALAITLVFDNIGSYINPEFYAIQKVMWKPQSIEGYVSSLFFVNEYQAFNFNGISPGSNGPYWSLSFEVTYYVIAGLFLFANRIFALPAIAALLFLGGNTIAALFPVWILGYLLYCVSMERVSKSLVYTLFIISIFLIATTPILASHLPNDNFGFEFPWGRGPFNRNLIKDYLPAIFFAVNLLCAKEILMKFDFKLNAKFELLIRWLGSLTFPLYLIHFPALALFSSISPYSNNTASNALFISLLTLSLVIIATPITDRLKIKMKQKLTPALERCKK